MIVISYIGQAILIIDTFILICLTRQKSRDMQVQRKLDLTDTIKDGARLFLVDEGIRRQLLLALTEDSKLHIEELVDVYRLLEDQIDIPSVALEVARGKIIL